MDVSELLYVIALVLAIVSLVDARVPWLSVAVILVCVGLLVGDVNVGRG